MIAAPTRERSDQLRELVAYEEKMMNDLPLHLCRERIESVKAGYIARLGVDSAKRIHAAMKAKYLARRDR